LSLSKFDVFVISLFSLYIFIVVSLALLNAGASLFISLLISITCTIAYVLICFGFSTKPKRRV